MNWNFDPTLVLGLAVACAAYALCAGAWRERFAGAEPLTRRQAICFALAIVSIGVALVSPMDVLADRYLLTMHMIQHLLLTLVMPPLLLLGLPGWMLRPALRVPLLLPLSRLLTRPIVAYALFNGVFGGWHVPALYEGMLSGETVHALTHLLFMLTAVINWWPVLSPLAELPRLPYPAQVLYLFLQSIIPTIVGGLITLSDTVLYATYANAPRVWNLTALEDQEIAGLIMWIPGALVYLTALTVVFFVWFEGKERAGEIR